MENGCLVNTGAVPSSEEYGAAVYNRGSLTVNETVFKDNIAEHIGGAIYNDEFGVIHSISNSAFMQNAAFWEDGGGIYNLGTLTTIANSTFSENFSYSRGGAIYSDNAIGTITNSTFSGNSTGGSGGAIYNISAIQKITSSTFSRNRQ